MILVERKRKKTYLLAIEEMRDRPMDGGQNLKEKGDQNRNGLFWLERKKVPGKFYHIYFGLITSYT